MYVYAYSFIHSKFKLGKENHIIKKIHLGNLITSFISSLVSLVLACACTHTHTRHKQPGNILRYAQLTFRSLEVTKPQSTLSRTKTLDNWPSALCAPDPLMGICRDSPTSSNAIVHHLLHQSLMSLLSPLQVATK